MAFCFPKPAVVAALCASIVFIQGCSFQKMGIRAASGVLETAALEIETETSYVMFRDGVPANIKTLEGLLYVDPRNPDLLLALAKAHVGYGFGVHETEYLRERLLDLEAQPSQGYAVDSYTRSLGYGARYLHLHGVDFSKLQQAAKAGKGAEYLSSHLDPKSSEDLEAVFFTGQAWASLINLQRRDVRLLAQLYVAKALIDWTCLHRPDFQFGACGMFYGAYDVGRPKMLGGNMQKGREAFEKAIVENPDNVLLRVAYIEQYAIPALDEEAYRTQKKQILAYFAAMQEDAHVPSAIVSRAGNQQSRLNLYNAIAERRFGIIQKAESELF